MPPKKSRPRGTGRRRQFDVNVAASELSATTGGEPIQESGSSAQKLPTNSGPSQDIPPIPKELLPAKTTIDWHQITAISRWTTIGLTVLGAVAYGIWYASQLNSSVTIIGTDVKEVRLKTDKLLLESTRNTVRLEATEARTGRLEAEVSRIQDKRK